MKINQFVTVWWSDDKEWFCLRVNSGGTRASVSLSRSEAAILVREARPMLKQAEKIADAFK